MYTVKLIQLDENNSNGVKVSNFQEDTEQFMSFEGFMPYIKMCRGDYRLIIIKSDSQVDLTDYEARAIFNKLLKISIYNTAEEFKSFVEELKQLRYKIDCALLNRLNTSIAEENTLIKCIESRHELLKGIRLIQKAEDKADKIIHDIDSCKGNCLNCTKPFEAIYNEIEVLKLSKVDNSIYVSNEVTSRVDMTSIKDYLNKQNERLRHKLVLVTHKNNEKITLSKFEVEALFNEMEDNSSNLLQIHSSKSFNSTLVECLLSEEKRKLNFHEGNVCNVVDKDKDKGDNEEMRKTAFNQRNNMEGFEDMRKGFTGAGLTGAGGGFTGAGGGFTGAGGYRMDGGMNRLWGTSGMCGEGCIGGCKGECGIYGSGIGSRLGSEINHDYGDRLSNEEIDNEEYAPFGFKASKERPFCNTQHVYNAPFYNSPVNDTDCNDNEALEMVVGGAVIAGVAAISLVGVIKAIKYFINKK